MNSKLAIVLFSAVLGVLFALLEKQLEIVLIAILAVLLGFCLSKSKHRFVLLALLGIFVGLGFYFSALQSAQDYLAAQARALEFEKTKSLEILELQRRKSSAHIYATADNAKVLIISTKPINALYKDKIIPDCKFSQPKNFQTSYGKIFNYQNYLKTKSVAAVCFAGKNTKLIPVQEEKLSAKDKLIRKIFAYKQKIYEKAKSIYNSRESALVLGMLFGAKGELDKQDLFSFQNSGLVHLVVLSGYNITLVLLASFYLLRIVFPFSAHFLAVFLVLVFAFATGFDPPTLRAVLMAGIFMVSVFFGAQYLGLVSLALAFLTMLAINPFYIFDAGFLFSFVASFSLVTFYPFVSQKFSLPGFLKEAFVSSLIVFFALAPLLAYFVGAWFLCSLPANLLVGPVVPAVMLLGFLSLAFPFGAMVSVEKVLLSYVYNVAEVFSNNYCVLLAPSIPLALVIAYYAALLFLAYLVSFVPKVPE